MTLATYTVLYVLFVLDCMSSVCNAELNVVLSISFQGSKEELVFILRFVSVLIFRLLFSQIVSIG